jgi:MerR family transcriptional regulator/heat shock protein HspR
MPNREEEYFTISVVAKRFDIHPQTLRVYEREGLLSPQRSEGNTRLYSRADLEQLKTILNLTRELGVNLAGVEVILHMKDQIRDMEKERERIVREFFEKGGRSGKKHGLVRVRSGKPSKQNR